jgi:hypothetical protein
MTSFSEGIYPHHTVANSNLFHSCFHSRRAANVEQGASAVTSAYESFKSDLHVL